MLLIPQSQDFKKVVGKINAGVHMRCGCQCHCPGGGSRCSGTCANCKKHIDKVFVTAHSAR